MNRFNINWDVRVKLTDVGRVIYFHKDDDIRALFPDADFGPREPTLDAEGYLRMQMWNLMRTFGHAMGSGMPVPFETTILLEPS